jgi:hypothetical protein
MHSINISRSGMLDLPTRISFGIGRSIVPPIKSQAAVGSPEWIADTERRMRRMRSHARRSGNWSRFVFLHMREDRWSALAQVSSLVPAAGFPSLFRKVWLDSKVIWRERSIVRKLISCIRPEFQGSLFTKADRERFDALPDKFSIYRGAKEWNVSGMAWTLDLQRAIYFATHHDDESMACSLPPYMIGVVLERVIHKKTVLFYSNDRGEEEIVLKRFEKGALSPEGTLWCAEHRGREAFAAELDKQRDRLTPQTVSAATELLSAWRLLEAHTREALI